MSGLHPTRVRFTPIEKPYKDLIFDSIAYLTTEFGVEVSFHNDYSKLVLEPNTGSWLDTIAINNKSELLALIIARNAIRIDIEPRMGEERRIAELYFFPSIDDTSRMCMELQLSSNVCEAVYGYAPRSEKKFDYKIKKDLLKICGGLARNAGADSFMYGMDDGELSCLELQDIKARICDPDIFVTDKRPEFITGVKNEILTKRKFQEKWGSNEVKVFENELGYVVFDLLQPFSIN